MRKPGLPERPRPHDPADHDRGVVAGFLAYGMWGLFPLYFAALAAAGPWEILSHRILWTVVVCALVLVVRRDLGWVRALLANRRLAAGVTAAAFLIATNWVIYVNAVLIGRTYEAALGYFLNPIVTVALGVVVLQERLRRLQWIAVGIGAVAAVYLTVVGGRFPWISLSLAMSFGLYGLTKNRVGVTMPALHSLTAETAIIAPVAGGILWWLGRQGATTFTSAGATHTTLLVLAGVVTATPLLLFAAAARRIPLSLVGLIQFITPVLQLLVAVVVLGEQVADAMWVGFGIVWLALGMLVTDSLRHARRVRRARRAASIAPREPVA